MSIFESILTSILGRRRILVNPNERAIHVWKGQVRNILQPGEHLLPSKRNLLTVEMHDLDQPNFYSSFEKALFDNLPNVAEEHLTVFRTHSEEVAVIERDRKVYAVLGPDEKLIVWTQAGPWEHQTIAFSGVTRVDSQLLRRLGTMSSQKHLRMFEVAEGEAGLLFVDGVLQEQLEPGKHAFWTAGRSLTLRTINLKRQSLDVSGQELLTRDRVTIRVNIAAEYRVTDPVKAATEVNDFSDAMYRELQYAFRKTLGAMTLDQILSQKGEVDTEAAGKVRSEMAAIGIEVSEIILKDVVLPGEMRDILNMVVAAEKEAEANVIRRREETNATRSLLNTAKVMADNPVMLRLKELEALETVASKVETLTIHNGTEGLMNDLVRLSDK